MTSTCLMDSYKLCEPDLEHYDPLASAPMLKIIKLLYKLWKWITWFWRLLVWLWRKLRPKR